MCAGRNGIPNGLATSAVSVGIIVRTSISVSKQITQQKTNEKMTIFLVYLWSKHRKKTKTNTEYFNIEAWANNNKTFEDRT